MLVEARYHVRRHYRALPAERTCVELSGCHQAAATPFLPLAAFAATRCRSSPIMITRALKFSYMCSLVVLLVLLSSAVVVTAETPADQPKHMLTRSSPVFILPGRNSQHVAREI